MRVEPAALLRSARRRLGLDQRSFGALLNIPSGTLASWESGRRGVPAAALDAALAAADLDLALIPRVDAIADPSLKRHLRLSLTQRLRLALGESPVLAAPPRSAAWSELLTLARQGRVILEPALAVALWVPLGRVPRPSVTLVGASPKSPSVALAVRSRPGPAPASLIPVTLDGSQHVFVLPPAELTLPQSDEVLLLRQAAALLDADAAIDQGGRRRPAHRDPDGPDEEWRLLLCKAMAGRERPDPRDGRAWRLGPSASLAQQLLFG